MRSYAGRTSVGFRVLFGMRRFSAAFLFCYAPRGAKKQTQSGGNAPHSKCGARAKGDNGRTLHYSQLTCRRTSGERTSRNVPPFSKRSSPIAQVQSTRTRKESASVPSVGG